MKTNQYEGRVVKKLVNRGSKSQRQAVVLEPVDPDVPRLILRMHGGNAYRDPILDQLVGRSIRGIGRRLGSTFIMTSYELLDEPEQTRRAHEDDSVIPFLAGLAFGSSSSPSSEPEPARFEAGGGEYGGGGASASWESSPSETSESEPSSSETSSSSESSSSDGGDSSEH